MISKNISHVTDVVNTDYIMYCTPRVDILGVKINAQTMEEAIHTIGFWIKNRLSTYVCLNNVHTIIESYYNQDIRNIYNKAGMATCDGMPLVWLCRLAGYSRADRIYGPDLMLALCEISVKRGWKHYFYGTTPEILEKLQEKLSCRFPGLCIVGSQAPPFRTLTTQEDQAIINQINATQSDIVWVGLGAPKQDIWMASHLGQISAPIMIGVGAAFDFLSGTKPQAPRLLQRSGLEWLFRLMMEPKRLCRRYLVY